MRRDRTGEGNLAGQIRKTEKSKTKTSICPFSIPCAAGSQDRESWIPALLRKLPHVPAPCRGRRDREKWGGGRNRCMYLIPHGVHAVLDDFGSLLYTCGRQGREKWALIELGPSTPPGSPVETSLWIQLQRRGHKSSLASEHCPEMPSGCHSSLLTLGPLNNSVTKRVFFERKCPTTW